MPFFDGASGRVYYRHWVTNVEPRASLIFLHGFGEHSGLYHRLAAELGAHGVELWALDQPGHGLSGGPRGDVGSFETVVRNARLLTGLAAQASRSVPRVVGGHSLGSLGALLVALDDPDAYRAVVISGAPLTPSPWLDLAVAGDSAGFTFDAHALSADPFYLDSLENDPLAFTEVDVLSTLANLFPPAWTRLQIGLTHLPLPILSVHGANDPIAPLNTLTPWRERLPRLEIEVIDNAAHDVLNEVAHLRVADRIGTFIADHTSTPTTVGDA